MQLKHKIKRFKIINFLKQNYSKCHFKEDWDQLYLTDELVKNVKDCVGIDDGRRFGVICHIINDSIAAHQDFMCKQVYLIPIKLTKGTVFTLGDQVIPFKMGHAIVFDDHISHGVIVANKGLNIIISIDG